jgi:hypothetical protein
MKMWNQTFRSVGRGVDKPDDREQIIVYAKRGREADRIKEAIKRAAKRELSHAELSAKGGSAGTGKAKARSSEAARAAVLKRWENHRAKTGKPNTELTGAQRPV